MKYIAGLLGVMLLGSQVWAAPEQMTMYATLSAPIASFREVKTELMDRPVTPKTELNVGSRESTGGAIKLKGNRPLEITNLWMENKTTLNIRANKWWVDKLIVADKGNVTINGYLIASELKNVSNGDFQINVSKNLRVGNKLQVQTLELTSLRLGADGNSGVYLDFPTDGSAGSATWATVSCSVREGSSCTSGRLLKRN
ncbi:MAG: hypothetical protein IJ876_04005 [Elusimicrobiaceae bacterium]|nr:hypothetical protein [Elusimicrobiaceae bacterium]